MSFKSRVLEVFKDNGFESAYVEHGMAFYDSDEEGDHIALLQALEREFGEIVIDGGRGSEVTFIFSKVTA